MMYSKKLSIYPCSASISFYYEFNAFFIDADFLIDFGSPFGSLSYGSTLSSNSLKKMIKSYLIKDVS
jgi:hypothetical protein